MDSCQENRRWLGLLVTCRFHVDCIYDAAYSSVVVAVEES